MSVRVCSWLVAAALAPWPAGCASPGGCPEDGELRAGHPSQLSPLARPSDTAPYDGYYVGGGSPCHGEGPHEDEGTWGWDYLGRCWASWVKLLWSHCREQGGTGAYQTDGPQLLKHEGGGE